MLGQNLSLSPPLQGREPAPHHLLRLLLGAEGVAVLGVELQIKGDNIVHGGVGRGERPVLVAVAAVVLTGYAAGLGAFVLGLV